MMELREKLSKEQRNQSNEDIQSPLSFQRSLPDSLHTAPGQLQKEHEVRNCSQTAINQKHTQTNPIENTKECIITPIIKQSDISLPPTVSNLECENNPSDNHSVVIEIEMTNQRQSEKMASSGEQINEIDLKQSSNDRGRNVYKGPLDKFINRKERPHPRRRFRTSSDSSLE